MSRKSSAMADGQPKFTVKVERVENPNQHGSWKATCENYPDIYEFGYSEQQAIRLLNTKLEVAVDKAEI